jgi:hypothetical protein
MERNVNYETKPLVTLGKRNRRWHLDGIDSDARAYLDSCFYNDKPTSGANIGNDLWQRKVSYSVDKLVKEMKSSGFWDICSIIYPFATYHKTNSSWSDGLNAKDPRFVAGAFVLSYSGNDMVHNTFGVTNNVSGSADTQFNPGTALGTNSWHICCYANFGSSQGTTTQTMTSCTTTGGIHLTNFNDATKTLRLQANGVTLDAIIGGRKGCFIGTRTTSVSMSLYRGGELVGNSTTSVVNSLPSHNQQLFFEETGSTNFLTVPFNFFSMGSGLTDDQACRLSTIVQDYQTRMGRAV